MRTVEIRFKPYFIQTYKVNGEIKTYQRKYLTVFDYQGFIMNRDRDGDIHGTPLDAMMRLFRSFEIRNVLVDYETLPYISMDIEFIINDEFRDSILNLGIGRDEDKIRNYFIEKYSEYIEDQYGRVTLSEHVKNNIQQITSRLYYWRDDVGDIINLTEIRFGATFEMVRGFSNFNPAD